MSKILVIAPHPDDEVLGCGGTIAKHTARGDSSWLCVVTKAYTPQWSKEFLKNRPEEIKKANKILGIKETFFLDYPSLRLDTIPQKELNDAIFKVLKQVLPDILYIPHKGDLNKDHRLVFEASLVATRPIISNTKKILTYETLSGTEWGQAIEPFIPNVYENISKTLKKKLEAIKAYKSELKTPPHPRSLEIIQALAKKRGSEVGMEFAEAFALVREIIS